MAVSPYSNWAIGYLRNEFPLCRPGLQPAAAALTEPPPKQGGPHRLLRADAGRMAGTARDAFPAETPPPGNDG